MSFARCFTHFGKAVRGSNSIPTIAGIWSSEVPPAQGQRILTLFLDLLSGEKFTSLREIGLVPEIEGRQSETAKGEA